MLSLVPTPASPPDPPQPRTDDQMPEGSARRLHLTGSPPHSPTWPCPWMVVKRVDCFEDLVVDPRGTAPEDETSAGPPTWAAGLVLLLSLLALGCVALALLVGTAAR